MRTIDADAFEREVMMMPDEELCEDCCYNVLAKLDDAPTVSGWVSVKDRMPDRYIHCIGYGRGVYALLHTGADGWFPAFITHWMPLPSVEGLHET